jgi:hypothetical protein
MYRTLLLLAFGFAASAQAQSATLTLACKGTTTVHTPAGDEDAQPISMGIIVNFADRTVHGFGMPNGPFDGPLEIGHANEVTVVFGGKQESVVRHSITGFIDRVTGAAEATWSFIDEKGMIEPHMTYTLQCKPGQRMF